MPQSLVKNYLHMVFSTKGHRPWLKNPELRAELQAYLAGACKALDCPTLIVGGVEDHVHILCMLSKNLAVAKLVQEIKRESSKWIKPKSPSASRFHWQSGYGAFSISPSHVHAVQEYIRTQETHHRHETFQDEFRRLLKKYDIPYDERYVWD